ncbi:MAG: ABC transporter substrate-binding protein, partial [Candidatus Omnitrophota bacterium]|nr:ABC transporter substrate-binding protein [Candidatus Omnitrophota bacterium]
MKKILFYILIVLLIPAGLAAEELKKVSFVPQWVPQAQFAGYYVAQDKGIYRKYGLDVEILPGGPEVSPAELLKAHKATFANMGLNTAIQEFAESGAIVNIAQIVKRSALMFVAKKTSGIKKIQDINNKKVG